MLICIYEDRAHSLVGVKLAVLSLNRHCPGTPISVHVPDAPAVFREWFARHAVGTLVTERPATSGWDVKPELLLHHLDRGAQEVVWFDSDVICAASWTELLWGAGAETLVATEETVRGQHRGGVHRTVAWGLEPGRSLETTVNTGLLRVTVQHVALLQRWATLLADPRYVQAQAAPWNTRPIHLVGDQEVLTALLGSVEFADVPLWLLRQGVDIAQCFGPSGWSPADRVRMAVAGEAPRLVHAMGPKPWQRRPPAADVGGVRRTVGRARGAWTAAHHATSPYGQLAAEYRADLDEAVAWLPAWRSRAGSSPALLGCAELPQALLDSAVRRARGALGVARYAVEGADTGRAAERLPTAAADRAPLRVAVVLEHELGHRTHLQSLVRAVTADPGVRADWVLVHPERTGWLELRTPLGRNDTARKSLRAARGLLPRAGRTGVVLVHTQTCATLLRPWLRSTPVVISTDGTPANIDELSSGYLHRQGGRREEALKRRLTGASFSAATMTLAWSRWTARSVTDVYHVEPSTVQVLSPGVDLDRWAPGPPSGAGAARLLFVGGDFGRKGGRLLLRALAQVDGPWRLDVVTASTPKSVTDPRVQVHTGLRSDDPELVALFRDADLFAFPTSADTYGIVVLEAMASGLPVITTPVGALGELVVDGSTGLLVQTEAELVAALQRLLDQPSLRNDMGVAGRARAEEHFDARRTDAQLLDSLRRAAASR